MCQKTLVTKVIKNLLKCILKTIMVRVNIILVFGQAVIMLTFVTCSQLCDTMETQDQFG